MAKEDCDQEATLYEYPAVMPVPSVGLMASY